MFGYPDCRCQGLCQEREELQNRPHLKICEVQTDTLRVLFQKKIKHIFRPPSPEQKLSWGTTSILCPLLLDYSSALEVVSKKPKSFLLQCVRNSISVEKCRKGRWKFSLLCPFMPFVVKDFIMLSTFNSVWSYCVKSTVLSTCIKCFSKGWDSSVS